MPEPRDSDDRIFAINEVVGMDAPFMETVQRAVEIGAAQLGVTTGYFTRIVPELDYWEVVASTDAVDGHPPVGETKNLGTTFCRHSTARDETIALGSVPGTEFEDDVAYRRHDWECYATTPVKIHDQLYGTLCFADRTPAERLFTDADEAFIDCLADTLERQLERAERELALEDRSTLLDVFSRVLRHNLRNDMTVVLGHVDLLADRLDNPGIDLDRLVSIIEEVVALAERSRELRRVAEAEPSLREYEVRSLLAGTATAVEADYPEATVDVRAPADAKLTAFPTLETALRELTENAAEHGGDPPSISLTAESDADTVHITVADDGPGLPEMERRVLDGTPENPLDHGQGIGLWIVEWVVAEHGGTIEPTVSEDGTEITLSVPRPSANERLLETPLASDS